MVISIVTTLQHGELTICDFFRHQKIHVEEGQMKCRGCGHIYPISTGIPNMVSSNDACFYSHIEVV